MSECIRSVPEVCCIPPLGPLSGPVELAWLQLAQCASSMHCAALPAGPEERIRVQQTIQGLLHAPVCAGTHWILAQVPGVPILSTAGSQCTAQWPPQFPTSARNGAALLLIVYPGQRAAVPAALEPGAGLKP